MRRYIKWEAWKITDTVQTMKRLRDSIKEDLVPDIEESIQELKSPTSDLEYQLASYARNP